MDEHPVKIIASKQRRTYTWEEEGRWREISEHQAHVAEEAEAGRRRDRRRRARETRAEVEAQIAENARRRQASRREWDGVGQRMVDDAAAFEQEKRDAKRRFDDGVAE